MTLDVDHLRSWIGRTEEATEEVGAELVRRFRAMLDEAPGAPQTGETAPRLLHWCLAPPVVPAHEIGPDGHPARGGFLPPVPLPRRMWAGGNIAFHDDLRIGDVMRRTSRIADVSVKHGRSGTLCFVTVIHEIAASERPILTEQQDIVYRDAEGGSAPPQAPPPAPQGRHMQSVDPSPVLLFRYSALTFNGHRIHYDWPYVTQVENYPGLVVHGPLQATLLLRFAASLRGAPPTRFSFRGQSPAFSGTPLALHADAEGDGLKLWTARPDGPIAMTAEARWD